MILWPQSFYPQIFKSFNLLLHMIATSILSFTNPHESFDICNHRFLQSSELILIFQKSLNLQSLKFTDRWVLGSWIFAFLNPLHSETTISSENSKAREKKVQNNLLLRFCRKHYVRRFRRSLILLNKERRDVSTARMAFKSFHVL